MSYISASDLKQIDGSCQIFGSVFKYLLDTGSCQCFMDSKYFERLSHKVRLLKFNHTYSSATGTALDIVGSFKCLIELGSYITKAEIDMYVVSNLNINSEVILGRDFISACPILSPGLDLMKQVAKDTTEGLITIKEENSFNVDLLLREYTSYDKPLTSESLKNDIETKMSSICSYSQFDLGKTSLIEFEIELVPNAKPIKRPYRALRPQFQDKVNKMVLEMLECGIIRRSKSPWCSQMVVALKSDGSPRLCVDFSPVNDVTVKFAEHLPRILEMVMCMEGAKFFTKLDLAGAFHQINIKEESRQMTAFATALGLMEYLVMPFGLTNCPAYFQRGMRLVFGEMIGHFIIVYIDDILIFSKTEREHRLHVFLALIKIKEACLKIRLEKCDFFGRKIKIY